MTENCKFRKAILSAFYNISQRNFGILVILWCSFKLWWNFCLDENLVYNANGPLLTTCICWQLVTGSLTCYKLFQQLVVALQSNNLLTSCGWQPCSNLITWHPCYNMLTILLQACCENILLQICEIFTYVCTRDPVNALFEIVNI